VRESLALTTSRIPIPSLPICSSSCAEMYFLVLDTSFVVTLAVSQCGSLGVNIPLVCKRNDLHLVYKRNDLHLVYKRNDLQRISPRFESRPFLHNPTSHAWLLLKPNGSSVISDGVCDLCAQSVERAS
jgi:hypothetical protein